MQAGPCTRITPESVPTNDRSIDAKIADGPKTVLLKVVEAVTFSTSSTSNIVTPTCTPARCCASTIQDDSVIPPIPGEATSSWSSDYKELV